MSTDGIQAECIRRLQTLNAQGVSAQFDMEWCFSAGDIPLSLVRSAMGVYSGIITVTSGMPKYQKILERLTPMCGVYKITPYFAVAQSSSFGELFSLLYVSNSRTQWDEERRMLAKQTAYVLTYNTDNGFEEIGCMEYAVRLGSLIRRH